MSRFQWLPAILLALSSNLDNVAAGVSYGIGKVYIPLTSNLIIALITSAGTMISMLAGQSIGVLLGPGWAGFVGGAILIALGFVVALRGSGRAPGVEPSNQSEAIVDFPRAGWMGRASSMLDNPFSVDRDFSRHIDHEEAVLLGFALTLNNITNGIAAGIAGLSPILVTTLVFILSILTLWVGMEVGYRFGLRISRRFAGALSGLLLVLIGVYEILSRGHS
ncbi:MAG: sporulation membrane protein YtaF [Terracidiphilus sp.]